MRTRTKVLLLAVLPLLAAVAAIAWVVNDEARALAVAEQQAVQPVFMEARRQELRNYVSLALAMIDSVDRVPQVAGRSPVDPLELLRRLDFGIDGYFFVYDREGVNLMHPRQPDLVGRNLIELRDSEGLPTIRRLLAAAIAGGGFVDYEWPRPSTGRVERKVGYVAIVPTRGWMIGTGLYLDEIEEAKRRIDAAASEAIRGTLAVIASIAVIAAGMVAAGGLVLNLSEQRTAEAKTRALARQVVTSQEEERARVARELHDGVVQSLVSVKFQVEGALLKAQQGDPGAAPQIERSATQLSTILAEMRRISHDLRPPLLDELGAPAAIEHLLADFGERTGLLTRFAGQADIPWLPEAVAIALFRVAQEAMTNVERHAHATSLLIGLQADRSGLKMRIIDNGRGFDGRTVARGAGLGLSNMRERIEALGGEFRLRSGRRGTALSVRLPARAIAP